MNNESIYPGEDLAGTTVSLELRTAVAIASPRAFGLAAGNPALPKTRDQLTLPLTSAAHLSDTVFYEAPTVSAEKFYLPRYRLGEEKVSGTTHYRMAFEKKDAVWSFVVVLEKFPAPELGLEARTARELPHRVEVLLRHRLFFAGEPGGMKDRLFTTPVAVEGGIRAILPIESLSDRDEVYRALTEGAYGTNLIVRRIARAAVAAPLPADGAFTLRTGAATVPAGGVLDVLGTESAGQVQWTPEQKISPFTGAQLARIGAGDFDRLDFAQLRSCAYSGQPLQCAVALGREAIVNITPHWNPPGSGGVYDTHTPGVWHTGSNWSIFHQDLQPMAPNAGFVITAARPSERAFVHRSVPSSQGWSPWIAHGAPAGGLRNAPAAVSRSPQFCNIYVRGADNALWQRACVNGQWGGWMRHGDGGVLITEPAVDTMGPNHEHVFVQGTDGNLYQKWWTGDRVGWRPWVGLGAPAGGFVGRPATVSRSPQFCNVYVRGRDNALWQLAWANGRWGGWMRHNDGVLTSPPAADSMNPNHEHVFVRGTDGQIWQKWWTGSWSAWVPLGKPAPGFSGGPSVISRGPAVCNVYVRGNDGAMWTKAFFGGAWHDWSKHSTEVALADDPATDSMNPNQEQAFIRGADGKVWQKAWPVTTAGTISGNTSIIDHPALNGVPGAQCQVTQYWNPPGGASVYNNHQTGIFYTGSRWAVFNQDMAPMTPGAAFSIRIPAPDKSFVHRAEAGNITGHVTTIRHPALDGKPNRMLLVTPNWNPGGATGVYNNHQIGIYYTGTNWAIFNQDMAPMPVNAAFSVEIVEAPEAAVHIARPQLNNGNHTITNVGLAPPDAVTASQLISIRLADGSLAKVQVLDCSKQLSVRWTTYSDAPRYFEEEANLELNRLRDSFVFPPNLYGYIFRGIEDVSGDGTSLVRHVVEWQGVQQPYYQDGARRRLFYYLPDCFKVARRSAPVRAPDVTVRVTSPDGSLERTVGSINFSAVPVTDPQRLAAALQVLRTRVPDGAGEPAVEPLPASALKFKLGVPKPGSPALTFSEQTNALVTMTGIRHSLELPVEALQAVFEGIFSSSSMVFQGQIEISLSAGDAIPPIPFQARMNDLAGVPLESAVVQRDGVFTATLRNAIESPLRIRRVGAAFWSGGRKVEARIEGLPLPADLIAGQEASFTLIPASALPADQPAEAIFDLSEVAVMADRDVIWNTVLDTTVQPEYLRTIGARTVVEVFRGDDPKVSLLRVNMRRAGGTAVSVDLTEASLTASARLSAPLRDYVLGRPDLGEFQYEVVAVRGGMRTTAPWKTASTDLIITNEDIA